MFLFLVSLATAEPLMTHMKVGDIAPFDGRLLNDEAVASILTNKQLAEEQCNLEASIGFSLEIAKKQLEIDYLKVEKETLEKKHEVLMELREQEIETLRKHINPKRAMWVFFGGFLLGTASSLGTYYAVNQIVEIQ